MVLPCMAFPFHLKNGMKLWESIQNYFWFKFNSNQGFIAQVILLYDLLHCWRWTLLFISIISFL